MGLCKKLGLAFTGLTVAASSAMAETTGVTLPETGIDMAGYAQSAISAVGAVGGVVVAGVIAFIVVRKGVKWIRSIG